MCGVAGFITLTGRPTAQPDFADFYSRVLDHTAQRGVDAYGVICGTWGGRHTPTIHENRGLRHWRSGEMPAASWLETKFFEHSDWSLANFRGIPTNEWHEQKDPQRSQPFVNTWNWISHNGQLADTPEQVANQLEDGKYAVSTDRQARCQHHMEQLVLRPEPTIDTEVLLGILDAEDPARWSTSSPERNRQLAVETAELLGKTRGSWAYAMINGRHGLLSFGRNYRGLYFALWEQGPHRALAWASEREAFGPEGSILTWELPPYSHMSATLSELQQRLCVRWDRATLSPLASLVVPIETRSKHNATSVAVVLSGGLDSTVCATMACEQYQRVYLVHFLYGARAETREQAACQRIRQRLEKKYPGCTISLNFPILQAAFGGNALTDHTRPLAQGNDGVVHPHEWVPARNTVFIAQAAAYCDQRDIGAIMLGLNMQEASVYRDNAEEFYREIERALNIGTMSRPRMDMPITNLLKSHIVKLGYTIGAPIDVSWSCYAGGEVACGTCGPCYQRLRGHLVNKLVESQPYACYPEWYPRELQFGANDEAPVGDPSPGQ